MKEPKTTLVLDSYSAVPVDDPVLWVWQDVQLDCDAAALLDQLLSRMLYFGRAESACRMRRLPELPAGKLPNCELQTRGRARSTPVLAAIAGKPLDLKVLLGDTDGPVLKGKPIPPGTAWHHAVLPEPRTEARGTYDVERRGGLPYVQFAVGGRVWPPLDDWVTITQRLRGVVLKRLAVKWTGDDRAHYGMLDRALRQRAALLSGKDADGKPLSGHPHARLLFWPDEDGQPRRLILWRREPFRGDEVEAVLDAAEEPLTWGAGGDEWAIRLVPLPGATPLPAGFVDESKIWVSITPFVPPLGRHRFRANGRERPSESVTASLKRLLAQADLPAPVSVTEMDRPPLWVRLHETRDRRFERAKSRTRLVRPGFWLRVEFAEPVRGPLVFGDSDHFGLGVFRALGDSAGG